MPSNQANSKDSSTTTLSAAYRLFCGFAGFALIVNLLVMNDFASFWNGAEIQNIRSFLSTSTAFNALLPHLKLEAIVSLVGFSEFWLRLPSVLVTMLGFVGIYFFGKRIFGVPTIMDVLLVLGSSFLVVNLAKVATGDSWLFALLSLNFITLILYLKQNIRQWQISHLIFLVLAAWVHPLSTLVFSLVSTTYLYFFHPKGQQIKQLYHWLVWLILLPLFYFLDVLHVQIPSFYLNYGNLQADHYLLWMLLGLLPWTGFIWAGLWEMIQKLRKKEEFAIIISAGLLASLCSQSLVTQTLLAIIVARQLKAYFHPNYPYKNIVQTAAILHLLVAIAAIIYLMIGSFDLFYLVGFRSAMAVGAVYWMPALVGVIGVIGINNRFIKGGMALSGILVTLVFWLQLYPLVESQRNLAKRLTIEVQTIASSSNSKKEIYLFHHKTAAIVPSLQIYLNQAEFSTTVLDQTESWLKYYEKGDILVFSDERFRLAQSELADLKGTELLGWNDFLKAEVLWVVKKAF